MRSATQSSNYYAIQKSDSARSTHALKNQISTDTMSPSAPLYFDHIQDLIKHQLGDELSAVGIELGRLAFEEFVIADAAVQKQRSENAKNIADTTAQVSNLAQKRELELATAQTNLQVTQIQLEQMKTETLKKAEVEAEKNKIAVDLQNYQANARATQDANTLKITQERELKFQREKAETDLEVIKMKAEGIKLEAAAVAAAKRMELEMQGELYRKYPELLQVEMMRLRTEAMASMKTAVISPEVAQHYYNFPATGKVWPGFFDSKNIESTGMGVVTNVAEKFDESKNNLIT